MILPAGWRMLGTLLVKTCLKQAQPGRADFSSSLLQHGNFSMIKALRACMFMILFHLGGALCSCIRLCTGHCNSIFLFVFLSLSLSLSLCVPLALCSMEQASDEIRWEHSGQSAGV